MPDEDYRGLSQADLVRKLGKLEAQLRYANAKEKAAMQLARDYENLVPDPAAASRSEANTGRARALPAPAPVEGGSGQPVQTPARALSGPVRRSARITAMRDRPGMERSAHSLTQAYRDSDSPSPSPPVILARRTNRQRKNQAASSADTDTQALVSALPVTHNRFSTLDARNSLLHEAGVHRSMALTSEDQDLISRTPDITSQSFITLFGGNTVHERPASRKRDILCVDKVAQPYAPHSAGESGLVLIYSDTVLLEDTCENFHLFLSMKSRQARYLGTYTKVPIVHTKVEKEEWRSLPRMCRNKWLSRICTSRKPDVRDALARSLHKQSQAASGALPSTDAIPQNPRIMTKDIRVALNTGRMEMEVEVIKYVRYDRGIAKSLQEHDSA